MKYGGYELVIISAFILVMCIAAMWGAYKFNAWQEKRDKKDKSG